MPTVPACPATLRLLRIVASDPVDPDAEDALDDLLPGDLRRRLFASDLPAEQRTQLANRLPPRRVWKVLGPQLGVMLAFALAAAEDAIRGDARGEAALAEMLEIDATYVTRLIARHSDTKERLRDGPKAAALYLVGEIVGLSGRRLGRYVDKWWVRCAPRMLYRFRRSA